jgi:hypothetical protein
MSIQRNGRRLDRDTSILFILTGVREPSLACLGSRDNTSALDKRVGEGRFSVVDCGNDLSARIDDRDSSVLLLTVRNNGHVPDIGSLVHKTSDL